MSIARDTELEDGRSDPSMTTSEVLQRAHAMAMQIEKLLMSPSCHIPSSDTFRVRLARAHALSLLDQLTELVDKRRPSKDDNAPSGVRPASPRF